MKILALGGTGAIGNELAALLMQGGHDLYITTRKVRQSDNGPNYLLGNAQDDDFLKETLKEPWDVIIDFMVYDTSTFARRIDALLGATEQYIFTSTARVFASSDSLLTERSPRLLDVSNDAEYLSTDEYALTKARQEDLLRASGKLNWTIIRPYITFGEGRLQLGTLEKEEWLYRALKGRGIVFCEALMDRSTTLTDSSEVARMIERLIGYSAALGQDYNVTGESVVTWGEVLSLYLDELQMHMGNRPQILLQDLQTFCNSAASVHQVIYDRMYDRMFDSSKIGQLINLSRAPDPLPTLRSRLHSQLQNQTGFRSIDWRKEALNDRALGKFVGANEIDGFRAKIKYISYRLIPLNILQKMRRPNVLH